MVNQGTRAIAIGFNAKEAHQEFQKAMLFLAKGPSATLEFLRDEPKAMLFAYKSQAIDGPCTPLHQSLCPTDPNFSEKQKAWMALGEMPRAQAEQEFLSLLTTLLPDWKEWYDKHAQSVVAENSLGEASSILKGFYERGALIMSRM